MSRDGLQANADKRTGKGNFCCSVNQRNSLQIRNLDMSEVEIIFSLDTYVSIDWNMQSTCWTFNYSHKNWKTETLPYYSWLLTTYWIYLLYVFTWSRKKWWLCGVCPCFLVQLQQLASLFGNINRVCMDEIWYIKLNKVEGPKLYTCISKWLYIEVKFKCYFQYH